MGKTVPRLEYVHSADEFEDFFAHKIDAFCQERVNAPPSIYAVSSPATLNHFSCITIKHVTELIASAPCKHADMDPMPTWLLKRCAQVLVPFLTEHFNMSLTNANFLSAMKMAMVTPKILK